MLLLRYKIFPILLCLYVMPAYGQDKLSDTCQAEDRKCVLSILERTIEQIGSESWKNSSYREYAKTLAFEGMTDKAIAVIGKISSPDTKAMTIRGIGMAMSDNGSPPEVYKPVFEKLRAEAEKIDHPPSYAIALTYISMSQAFAGDNEGAAKTAGDMENDALRNKAYGENAEIQAKRGELDEALKSLSHIKDTAFRNKAYNIVSEIFSKEENFNAALKTAIKITNPTIRADAIQFMLDQQKPRDVERKTPVGDVN